MLPIENGARAVTPPTLPSAAIVPRDASGRPDVAAIATAVTTRAASDPQGAGQQFAQIQAGLSPVQQGELARAVPTQAFAGFDFPIPLPPIPIPIPGFPGSGGPSLPIPQIPLPTIPSLPFPGIPGLPGFPGLPSFPGLPGLPNPIDLGKELFGNLKNLVDTLGKLPHAIADKLADSMRGDKARTLTPDEKAAIKEAYGNTIDLDKVRIVDGPGNSPIAAAAFKYGGNPAITVGNTIYIRHDVYSTDFTKGGGNETLLHEFTHVVQYDKLGYSAFATKYGLDLARCGGDRDKVYRYDERNTTFAQETLEGQAQMVGDYAKYRNSTDPEDQQKAADIAKRLEGTGIYGL